MKHRQQTALHIDALTLLLRCVGIDGMVSQHHHPVLMGVLQRGVEPCQLRLCILLRRIGIDVGVLAIGVDERCGVEHHHADGGVLMVEHLRVILGAHHPAAAHLSVVHERLRVAPILVVATHGKPVEHEVGMRIDPLEIGEPKGILQRGHAIEMMNVAHGQHTLGVDRSGHLAHQLGDGLLLIIAVAPHVVGHVECYLALERLPCGSTCILSWGEACGLHHAAQCGITLIAGCDRCRLRFQWGTCGHQPCGHQQASPHFSFHHSHVHTNYLLYLLL